MGIVALTGSASGIGASTRALLEARGDEVIGVDLRDAEVVADLADADARRRAVDEILDRCGGTLDGLVTSAGVGPPFDPRRMLAINWFGTEVFLSGLREALAAADGISKVVAVSSNSTTTNPNVPRGIIDGCLAMDEAAAHAALDGLDDPSAMSYAYAGAKTAVARYVRRHAPSPEWAGSGIRLNAIAPGATQTPLLQAGLDDDLFGALIRGFAVPTGAFGTPEVVARWIVMMMSDAADFMCGSVVFVDGGTDALLRAEDWPSTFEMDLG